MKAKKIWAIILSLTADAFVLLNPFISRQFDSYTVRSFNPFPQAIYSCCSMLIFCGFLCTCTYLFTQINKSKTVFWVSAVSAVICTANFIALYLIRGDLAAMSLALSVFFTVFAVMSLCRPSAS